MRPVLVKYETAVRTTPNGPELVTRELDEGHTQPERRRHLRKNGIVRIGARVKPKDALVGKLTPMKPPEERLLSAIFGERAVPLYNASLTMDRGEGGIVTHVQILSREAGDELPEGVEQIIRVFVAQDRAGITPLARMERSSRSFERWLEKVLDPRQLLAFKLHVGFDDGKPRSFKEIGEIMLISPKEAEKLCSAAEAIMREHPQRKPSVPLFLDALTSAS